MKKPPNSPDDVRRALRSRLGHQPRAGIWALLRDDGWIDGAQSLGGSEGALYSLEELVDRYRAIEKALSEAPEPLRERPRAAVATVPHGRIAKTAAKIAAIEAADHPYVVAFRESVLGGRLLGWQEAQDWLAQRFQDRRRWRFVHLPHLSPRSTAARSMPGAAEGAVRDYMAGGHYEGGSQADTELDYLFCLCDVLIETYRFADEGFDLPLFVLTGIAPMPLSGQLLFDPPQDGSDLRNGTVAIYISARVGPRELMERYSEFRVSILDEETRVRDVSQRTATLALFVAASNDGRSWSATMAAWNANHGDEKRYEQTRLFARDGRTAYETVMGRQLIWRGGRDTVAPRGLQPPPETLAEIEAGQWQSIKDREKRREERRAQLRARRQTRRAGAEETDC